jgi:glycosyltransferase involved in cell wall biosynthesis
MAIPNAQPRVAYVSTYPPRACGIATFTRDLSKALMLRGQVSQNLILPIENDPTLDYQENSHTIAQHKRESYVSAANFLNESDNDVVSLQHEFGIFGGECGEYVLDFCRNLKIPLVTTFHTVLRDPPRNVKQIVREISATSIRVVVTIESAAKILEKHFDVGAEKIVVIPHGVALPDCMRRGYAKRQLGLRGRTILATHGLISSGKGIEFAIESLSHLVKERPNLLYLIIGKTHPEVQRYEGEAYRYKLIALTEKLGVTRNVRFVNYYLRDDDLSLLIQAIDIYLAPYLGKDQVSSGTLTLALGHGKAVISTPTIFAREILSKRRGLLCKFSNAQSIADCVKRILGGPILRHELEKNASIYGQEVGWTKVADQYGAVLRLAMGAERTVTESAIISETPDGPKQSAHVKLAMSECVQGR